MSKSSDHGSSDLYEKWLNQPEFKKKQFEVDQRHTFGSDLDSADISIAKKQVQVFEGNSYEKWLNVSESKSTLSKRCQEYNEAKSVSQVKKAGEIASKNANTRIMEDKESEILKWKTSFANEMSLRIKTEVQLEKHQCLSQKIKTEEQSRGSTSRTVVGRNTLAKRKNRNICHDIATSVKRRKKTIQSVVNKENIYISKEENIEKLQLNCKPVESPEENSKVNALRALDKNIDCEHWMAVGHFSSFM